MIFLLAADRTVGKKPFEEKLFKTIEKEGDLLKYLSNPYLLAADPTM
jgi:hypothetical protein